MAVNLNTAQKQNAEVKIVGNKGLSSSKDDFIAQKLKERNLDRVNQNSAAVQPKTGFYTHYIKRVLDIVISFAALTVLLPVNVVLGICTYFDVGRPIFFRQSRVGKDGEIFELVKFRNMTNKTDADGNLLPPSQRVTKFGKFVRKYSLDELLNFWSVLKGDMSIIGPRPLPIFFHERYSDRHKMRCAVKPGLECPRVIPTDESVSKYHVQFENDIWYVENISFMVDCKMVFQMFTMVFNRKYRSKTASVNSYFAGYDDDNIAISSNKAAEKYPELAMEYEQQSKVNQ